MRLWTSRKRLMRIDAHQHFWSVARGDYPWMPKAPDILQRDYGPDDLTPLLEVARLDATVLIQAAPTEDETHFMIDVAASAPMVAGIVGWVDLAAPDATEAVGRMMAKPKVVGLRPMLQDIEQTDWILDPVCEPGLRALAEAGGVFDALGLVRHLEVLDIFAARHPDLSVVLDHGMKPDIAGKGFTAWAPGMERLARHGHVTCKLSGFLTEAAPGAGPQELSPYVAHLLDVFGPDRLIFGSDWPVMTASGQSYADWMGHVDALISDLGADDQVAIMGGNATRVYDLSLEGRA